MSAATKLCGFLLLLGIIFAGAYAAGSHLGPVTTGYSRSGMNVNGSGSGSGGMNMNGPGSRSSGSHAVQGSSAPARPRQ